MANVISPGGVDYRFQPPKWCRHKDQFLTYVAAMLTPTYDVTCSNCGGTANGATRPIARDALMRVEKVAIVTEVPAP